jgi:hypothetical protein
MTPHMRHLSLAVLLALIFVLIAAVAARVLQ